VPAQAILLTNAEDNRKSAQKHRVAEVYAAGDPVLDTLWTMMGLQRISPRQQPGMEAVTGQRHST
jgi:hypothetical protein